MNEVAPRDLNANERELIELLARCATVPAAKELVDQIACTRVVGGIPTLLDLQVSRSARSAAVKDGVIPVRAFVEDPDGETIGEVIVWVKDGYLSGLEYAWFTDEPPSAMPAKETIRLQ